MATDAQIRGRLISIIDEQLSRNRIGLDPLTRGPRILRRGRHLLCTTSRAGTLLYATVTRDLKTISFIIGSVANIRHAVPPTLRQSWQDGQSDEQSTDPNDGS